MVIPLNLPARDQFTDDELVTFCLSNPDLQVERDENGQIFINMSPTHLLTSSNNSELNGEFVIWNRRTKAGKVIDSNGGFFLPDKSMRAPDVAWIRKERWEQLSTAEKKSFPHMAPDFVLELESDTDNVEDLKQKMTKWITNGVRLGWLISMSEQQTYIYRPSQPVETKAFSEALDGGDVLIDFEVVLNNILEI
ncbi:Uma2 family endonuclease [Runella salmonicolor]|uniref:Uma2 family endonuclease n=1 Tax=Runella salmonicolor TaxID=2950278 RepID=A0ABT1FJ24_9BACT|nr:Uma2 family endonuclease [Runella salmonicolor]MCP1381746.1 Uma2 family endonuclease [Runella salmonicolor]